MLPVHPGGMAFLEWDYINQNKDWNGKTRGQDDNNTDKHIETQFFTLGIQYMLNRSWGLMAEIPYDRRYFKTIDDNGNVEAFKHGAVGDIRLRGIYSGFSEDMSTGVTFGLKLPSGDYADPDFDRDTSIGSGSTDVLLGAYHFGKIPRLDAWDWYANVQSNIVALISGGYRPGSEVDGALGVYYDRWRLGAIRIAPIAQLVGSHRWSDSGILANAPNTGFDRLLVAPGVEFDSGPMRLYTDVGFPVYQYMKGDQLVASEYYKVNIGYMF